MEDEIIIQLFFNRNEDAIHQTAEKYGSRLRAISQSITCDSETAKECENDTYMEAWNRIPPCNPKDYYFSFLARIIRCISIDRCRKNTSLKRVGIVATLSEELANCIPAVNDVEDEIEAKLLWESISKFLLTLSDEKQVMFMRRYFYLDSISEIARRMSSSESKVKTSLFRLRNDLKEYLIKGGYTI